MTKALDVKISDQSRDRREMVFGRQCFPGKEGWMGRPPEKDWNSESASSSHFTLQIKEMGTKSLMD